MRSSFTAQATPPRQSRGFARAGSRLPGGLEKVHFGTSEPSCSEAELLPVLSFGRAQGLVRPELMQ